MTTQADKGRLFRALHERDRAFIIPNPWDAGSARLLAQLGFEALATTSAGYAFSAGRRDNAVGRDLMIAHVAAVAAATDLPVSADLENGYGDDPAAVAETIRQASAAGAAGGSIEDATGRKDDPIYEQAHAVERIAAAAETARGLGVALHPDRPGRELSGRTARISPTPSGGSRPIRPPARTSSTRRA